MALPTISATQYRTRQTVRLRDLWRIIDSVGTVHARPFRGHPPGTVLITNVESITTPDGRRRVTVSHEAFPGAITHICGRPVYDPAPAIWYGRWHGQPRIVSRHMTRNTP